jgi:LacI family transcriptional regulator
VPPNKARLKDIAAVAGVDISIVSRALNNDPNLVVTPETRKRILSAARKLKYRPNAMARGLRQAQTYTLGLIVPEVANFVFAELIQGVEQRAFAAGYVLLLANASDFGKTEEMYKRLVLEGRVDGLLIASARDDEQLPFDLEETLLPILWVNRRGRVGPHVIEDDEGGLALAVDLLVALGHRRIAHIAGPQHFDTGRRRLLGFQHVMSHHQLELRPEYVAEGPFTEQGGYEAMQRLLQASPLPTALTVSSNAAAIGALAAAKNRGLAVPADLSLIAFHDSPIAAYLDPPLTTIQMPLRELGELAVDQLLKLMAGEPVPTTTVVGKPIQLIERGSTAPPRRP